MREGAVLPQNCTWTWLTPYAVCRCMFPSLSRAPVLGSYHWLICMFYQRRYTPAVIQIHFLHFPTKMFSSLLSRTCKHLKMVLLSIGKCRNEYSSCSFLKQVPFNSRVPFSETRGLASVAQKGVLRKHLCQPFCRRREGLTGKVFAVGFSLAPAVTVGCSYMQHMLLNLLQLQVEQWQLLQRAAILAYGVEIHTAVLQTRPHPLAFILTCLLIYTVVASWLQVGKITRLLSCATK